MKRFRNSFILLAILAIIAVFLLLKNNGGTFMKKENTFAVSDTSNVTRLFLSDKNNNSVTLSRADNGSWVLNNKYEVNPAMIEVMLTTLISIEPKSPVSKGTRNTIIRMLASKSVKAEIYQRVYRINLFDKIKLFPHEKRTRTYYVGDPTMDNSGTFMLMEGSEDPYIVDIPGFRGFVGSRYSSFEGDWRSHSVFRIKVPEIKSVSVNFSEKPEHSYRITNQNNQIFTLTSLFDNRNVENFDTTKVVGMLSLFRNLNYERVLDEMKKPKQDSILKVTPTKEIVLVDKLGKSHSLKMWKRKADIGQLDMDGNQAEWDLERMYALVDNSEFLVSVQYFVFNDVLAPLPWFVTEK
jgi:hypothetical protein